jgi:hypothetical protein
MILLTLAGWTSIPLFLRDFAHGPFAIDAWTANGWRYGVSALLWAPVLVLGLWRRNLPQGHLASGTGAEHLQHHRAGRVRHRAVHGQARPHDLQHAAADYLPHRRRGAPVPRRTPRHQDPRIPVGHGDGDDRHGRHAHVPGRRTGRRHRHRRHDLDRRGAVLRLLRAERAQVDAGVPPLHRLRRRQPVHRGGHRRAHARVRGPPRNDGARPCRACASSCSCCRR